MGVCRRTTSLFRSGMVVARQPHLWLDPELTVHGHLAKASSKHRIVFNGGNVTAKTLQQRNEHRILCSFVISSDSCRMNASGRQAVASTRCLPAVHPLSTSGKPPSISLAEVKMSSTQQQTNAQAKCVCVILLCLTSRPRCGLRQLKPQEP